MQNARIHHSAALTASALRELRNVMALLTALMAVMKVYNLDAQMLSVIIPSLSAATRSVFLLTLL